MLDPLSRVLEDVRYDDLRGLWWAANNPTKYGISPINSETYQGRVNVFCLLLEYMLRTGEMRLANSGVFLEGTAEQLANRFKIALADKESVMEEQDSYWVFMEWCPGGAVWYTDIDDNGFQTSPVGDGRFYYWT